MAAAIMSVRTPTTRPAFGLLAGVFIVPPMFGLSEYDSPPRSDGKRLCCLNLVKSRRIVRACGVSPLHWS
jgi:hypothetical protein